MPAHCLLGGGKNKYTRVKVLRQDKCCWDRCSTSGVSNMSTAIDRSIATVVWVEIGLPSSDLYICVVHSIWHQSNYFTSALIQPEYCSVCLRSNRMQTKHLRSRINCEWIIEQARCDGLSVTAMLTGKSPVTAFSFGYSCGQRLR